jgi:hypothetical protein
VADILEDDDSPVTVPCDDDAASSLITCRFGWHIGATDFATVAAAAYVAVPLPRSGSPFTGNELLQNDAGSARTYDRTPPLPGDVPCGSISFTMYGSSIGPVLRFCSPDGPETTA